jgi:hypothetical protein
MFEEADRLLRLLPERVIKIFGKGPKPNAWYQAPNCAVAPFFLLTNNDGWPKKADSPEIYWWPCETLCL